MNRNISSIPTLLPPIEMEGDEDSTKLQGCSREGNEGNVLSRELRGHFDTMKALKEQCHCSENNRKVTPESSLPYTGNKKRKVTSATSSYSSDTTTTTKRPTPTISTTESSLSLPSSSNGEMRMQALKTACAAETEISRLMNGIAELEALLAATASSTSSQQQQSSRPRVMANYGEAAEEQQQQDAVVGNDIIAFPPLPPVVPIEDYSDDDSSSDGKK